MHVCYYPSPIGTLAIITDAHSVWQITPNDDNNRQTLLPKESALIHQLTVRLQAYFQGEMVNFQDIPLATRGTPFQQQVWQALTQIPYGKHSTYGELARSINRPQAARAVGAAVGANPWVVILPCHRVLGLGNYLTGYRWGLASKRKLLELENIRYR
ncbi:MAG: methylated-DNA--[protein]-cysteine S-methyltransferase [Candidatus Symbiodolus clandestinus]